MISDSGDDFMNFSNYAMVRHEKSSGIPDSLIFHVLPMVAEDILPLIEGDDDSLDTLMLGFE